VGLLTQVVEVAALTLWFGAVVLGRRAQRAGVTPARLGAVRLWAPAAVVVAVVVRAAAVATRVPTLDRVAPTVLAGRAGVLGLVVAGAAAAAGLVVRRRRLLSLIGASVALTATVAAGHAGASTSPGLTTAVLVVHLMAAGAWVFAIVAALLSPRVRTVLATMSPPAVTAAIVVATTGVAGAALERVGPAQLVATGYGRVVLAKAVAFAAVAGLGLWHAHRRRRSGAESTLRLPVRLEALAAGLALTVAVVLGGSPPPVPSIAVLASGGADSVLGPLDGGQALSIAGATGSYVVGLTIAPARPGPVTTRVEILSPKAHDPFGVVTVDAFAPAHAPVRLALHAVGTDVYSGAGRIDGDGAWTFTVSFADRGVINRLPLDAPLPAPDGSAALARAFSAESRLRSVQLHETLASAPDGPMTVADYRFRAPDSFSFTVNGSQEVDIGARSYRRDTPTASWTAENSGAPFAWPSPYFPEVWGNATAARVVGAGVIDGIPSHIVAFVRPDLPAWFALWIGDADGLVRREEMQAEGHLMSHHYTGFDAGVPIVAPA
ncbi:MAG TPA: CopD family protein, partial [Acidimicrobiales bacterium]|nr:CopD family protein [Acidimicrobiales bacterium]